jgi:acetoin:2,6-dichlorophenolindophenol oxidoreductase subunit alpha
MDFAMRMPDLATVDETVTIVGWLKAVGQQVKRGEPLLEVETDKAILPVESPVVGVLSEITAATGAEVAMGQVIARLSVVDETTALATPSSTEQSPQHSGDSRPIAAQSPGPAKIAPEASRPVDGAAMPRVSMFERNRQARAQLNLAPAAQVDRESYKPDFLKTLYERMVLIREFEDGVKFLFLEGSMPGTIHQCQGQEATAVGVCAALEASDSITSTFRGHGHALAKGLTPEELLFELFGAVTGCCRGKGGSMHVGNMQKGMVPGIAIVGGGVPLAAGMGLALKMQKSRSVVACFFGDGAIAEGAFHEGVNLAAIWDLPVIFVCENNLYGASTRVDRVMRNDCIADRGAAYGIKGERVDGNDVLAVYEATLAAAARCRAGSGPVLLELLTYRRTGHSRRDGCHYQPQEEKEAWFARDPIVRLGQLLKDRGLADQAALETVQAKAQARFRAAVEEARSQPLPVLDDLTTDVFA